MLKQSAAIVACLLLTGCQTQLEVVKGDFQTVYLEEDILLETAYNPEMIPACLISNLEIYGHHKKYATFNETDKSSLELVHRRMMEIVRILKADGGHYRKIEGKYAIYEEAYCSLGVQESAALQSYLDSKSIPFSAEDIGYIVTGKSIHEYEDFFPDGFVNNYDPENFSQFKMALDRAAKILNWEYSH